MIATRTYHVILKKTFQKILYLSTAAHDTFAFLAVVDVGRDALYHCDSSGAILYEYRFEHPVDSFAMPTNSEVAVLSPRGNKIYLFDLVRRRFQTYNHEFMYEEADQSEVFAFSATNYLCVREKGGNGDHRLHLTYYQHPLSTYPTPITRFHSKDNQWTSNMEVFKADNHSLFAWCKRRQDDEIDVRTFDLRGNSCGEFKQFLLKSTLGSNYNLPKVEIAINNVFEVRPNELCLVCFSSKNESRAVNKDGVVNNNFILNTECPLSPYICESKFYFEGHWNDCLIDCLSVGAYAVFRTFEFRASDAQPSPVFYISGEGELICSETWKCTYRTKLFVPGYSDHTLIEAEYENGEVSEFTLHEKRILNPSASLRQRLQ
jgi:hypothetical protein